MADVVEFCHCRQLPSKQDETIIQIPRVRHDIRHSMRLNARHPFGSLQASEFCQVQLLSDPEIFRVHRFYTSLNN